jgi:PKD repeat protein
VAFEIRAGSPTEAKLTSTLLGANPEVFGFCSGVNNSQSFNLTNESTGGSGVTAVVTDELNGGAPTTIFFNSQIKAFVAQLAHYTIFVKAQMPDGSVATRAYLLANNRALTTFSTQGTNTVCLPGGSLEFLVDIDGTNGIKNNFPGNMYVVNWGDGREDTYTLCDIRNNASKISHVYSSTSCGETFQSGAIIEYNAFGINISAKNQYCGNVGTAISTTAKVITKPVNSFTFDASSCLNAEIIFTNTSDPGKNPNTNSAGCIDNVVTYTWYVDGIIVAADKPKSYALPYTFNSPGTHTVRLESSSTTAQCPADPVERSICIQAQPIPSFTLNGGVGVTLCSPVTLKPTNTSFTDNTCSSNTYQWVVTGGPFTYASGNANSFEPEFNFTGTGIYKIKLVISTPSCGRFESAEQTIVLNSAPTAVLSPDVTLCNLTSYEFNDVAGPTRTTFTGTLETRPDTYAWTVTGGAFTFDGGTDATSQYPVINFTEYKVYTVSVTHTNNCGAVTRTQTITFKQSPIVNAGGVYPAICFDDDIILNGSISEPVISHVWLGGNGTFTPDRNALNVTYSPTAAERASGRVDLTLRATTALAAPCNTIDGFAAVMINPQNILTSPAEKRICTESRVNYTPLSTVSGSTFSWTATGTPNIAGLPATGSGNQINDLLTNTSATANGVVVYRITPASAGCTGETFEFTVTVTPKPVLTATPVSSTICSGEPTAIVLNSNLPNTRYLWYTIPSGPTITGNVDNLFLLSTVTQIDDILVNSGTAPGSVIYKITPYSEDDCPGAEQTVTITVNPPATVANAGIDESICAQSSYTLKGNNPLVGTGRWTIVAGPPAGVTFADDTKNNTLVSGLQNGVAYTFRWTITAPGNCSPSQDDVMVTVNRLTNGGNTAGTATVCSGDNSGQIILSGNEGNVIRWESSTNNGLNWQVIPETTITHTYTNLSITTQFRAVVQNGVCAPANSSITTINVSPPTVAADAGDAQVLCNMTSVTLNGNDPAPNTGKWTQVSGPAVTIVNANSNVTTVTGLTAGQSYLFKWTITGAAPCPPTSDDVLISNLAPLQNTISSTSTSVCSGQGILISGSQPSGGNGIYTYAWESSPDGSTWNVISGETGADLNTVLTTTLSFRRTVNSGTCSMTSTPVRVIAQPPLGSNSITGVQPICEGSVPVALTGSVPTGGDGNYIYKWQQQTNGVDWNDIPAATAINFSPPALSVTTVYRRIVSTLACTGTLQSISNEFTIKVNPNAKAEFTFQSDISCVPFNITADNVKAVVYPDRNAVYTWYVNGAPLPGNTIAFPGYTIDTYDTPVDITLKVTSSLGCSEATAIPHTFRTPKNITASFKTDVIEGCGPLTVRFTNESSQLTGVTFSWNFNNGQTSAKVTPDPVILLPDPSGNDKVYEIILTARTDCAISEPDTVKVLVRAPAMSVFAPDKTVGCSPLKVNFRNNSPDASNTTYTFDYGDGSTPETFTNRSTVPHEFTTTTDIVTYTVKMTAKGPCGPPVTTFHYIKVSPNKVIADLVVNGGDEKGCAPYTVKFYNRSKGADNFVFDFGDGTDQIITRSSPDSIMHTFKRAGRFNVTMTASSDSCAFDSTIETINVFPSPIASFTADKQEGCPGLEVQFTNTSTDAVSYHWDFGDGETSDNQHPVHSFKGDKPDYTVKLTVKNSLDCSNTVTMQNYIHMFQPSIADFTALPGLETSIPNYTFKFLDASNRKPDKWHWDFGDGFTSEEQNPTHTYQDVGAYTITLTVSNQTGCPTTVSKIARITGTPGYLYVPNSFIPGSERIEFQQFRAKGSGLKSWKFSIFDKWGELMWETTKLDDEGKPLEGWDGTFKGVAMPQGVYFWKIDVQLINGSEWKGMTYDHSAPKRTGAIHLIR